MQTGKEPGHRPMWVEFALFGISTRGGVLGCMWLSIGLAVAGVIGGFFERVLFLGILFLLAAMWYYLAIRWMDENDGWAFLGH